MQMIGKEHKVWAKGQDWPPRTSQKDVEGTVRRSTPQEPEREPPGGWASPGGWRHRSPGERGRDGREDAGGGASLRPSPAWALGPSRGRVSACGQKWKTVAVSWTVIGEGGGLEAERGQKASRKFPLNRGGKACSYRRWEVRFCASLVFKPGELRR